MDAQIGKMPLIILTSTKGLSAMQIVTVPKTMKDIGECLSSQHVQEKSER